MYQMEYAYLDNKIIEGAKYVYTYDSYDEPTLAIQYNFNIDTTTFLTGWYDTIPYYISYYYYETYYTRALFHNAGIASVSEGSTMQVYPNPAASEINIYWPGVSKGTEIEINIVTATGQKVITENIRWQKETETLSIRGLTPGMYFVHITNNATGQWKTFKLIKE
jgi:hypothetical protein